MKKIFCFIAGLVLFLFVSCKSSAYDKKYLPKNAIVLRDLGNNWIIFKLDGCEFLYYREDSTISYKGFVSITLLRCKK